MCITPHMRQQQDLQGKCRLAAAAVVDSRQKARPLGTRPHPRHPRVPQRQRRALYQPGPTAQGTAHQSQKPCRGAPFQATKGQTSSHLSSDAAVWKTPAPFLRRQPAPRAATAFSRLAGSEIECTSVPLRIRPSIPASCPPGPSSRKQSNPSPSRYSMLWAQRTLPVT